MFEKVISDIITKFIDVGVDKYFKNRKDEKIVENEKNKIVEFLRKYDNTTVDRADFQKIIENKKINEKINNIVYESFKLNESFEKNLETLIEEVTNEFKLLVENRDLTFTYKHRDDTKNYIEDLINSLVDSRNILLTHDDKMVTTVTVDEIRKNTDQIIDKLGIQSECINIEHFAENIKQLTEPSISLDFFDYKNNEFEKEFFRQLLIKKESCIYIQSTCNYEALYYVIYILNEHRYKNVLIIEDENTWKKINGKVKGKILIANFISSNEVLFIPNNICIFSMDISDICVRKDLYL